MRQLHKKKVLIGCDLLPVEDNSPHHIQGDIMQILQKSPIGFWDLIILHPPCTAIALSGNSTHGHGMRSTVSALSRSDELLPCGTGPKKFVPRLHWKTP